jgi:hypothetical protein
MYVGLSSDIMAMKDLGRRFFFRSCEKLPLRAGRYNSASKSRKTEFLAWKKFKEQNYRTRGRVYYGVPELAFPV